MIAQKYGQDTILSSLQLGVEDTGNFGNCNWGYSCAYTNSISWASPTQPLPTQVNPRVVFERLFGDGTSPEERLHGPQAERQHPRLGDARARRVQDAISAPATRRASTPTSRTSASSSAASASRWTTR